jgi:hypothetical protein
MFSDFREDFRENLRESFSGSGDVVRRLFYLVGFVVVLIIFFSMDDIPSRTADERAIDAIKQGQRDVCKKWGDLRPECR